MSDKWEPTIEPTPCVDKNGVFITKGMKVLYTSVETKPPYSKVAQEGTTISDPVFMRNIWGEHYWIVNIKGNGWSATGPRVHEIEAVTAERLSKGPSDIQLERDAIAAWLRSEPETVKECSGHRHKDGKKCLIITPMTMAEIADAIAKGDYPREKE